MIAIVPILASIVGLLMYVLATNAKLVEIGKIVFAMAFLVTMFTAATHVIKVL